MSLRRVIILLYSAMLVVNAAALLLVLAAPGDRYASVSDAAIRTLAENERIGGIEIDPEQAETRFGAETLEALAALPLPEAGEDAPARVGAPIVMHPGVLHAIAQKTARSVASAARGTLTWVSLFLLINSVLVLAAGYFTLFYWPRMDSAMPPSRGEIIGSLALLLLVNGFGAFLIPSIEISGGVAVHLAAVTELGRLEDAHVLAFDHEVVERHYRSGSNLRPPVLIARDINTRVPPWPFGPRLLTCVVLNSALAVTVFVLAMKFRKPREVWTVYEEERFDADDEESWELGQGLKHDDEDDDWGGPGGTTWGPAGGTAKPPPKPREQEWELGAGLNRNPNFDDDDPDDDGTDDPDATGGYDAIDETDEPGTPDPEDLDIRRDQGSGPGGTTWDPE